jgi:hypothetical protein
MSNPIYGFLNINRFFNGQAGINPVGQISPKGMTFGTSSEYSADNSNSQLIIFQPNLLPVVATIEWITGLATQLSGVVNYTVSQSSLLNNIITALGTRFTNITIGTVVMNPVDGKGYPTFIKFTYTTTLGSATFKVWLANTNFINEYPDGDITVVTPIINVSDLFNNFAACKAVVDKLTVMSIINEVATLNLPIPETGIYTNTFRVNNRANVALWFDLPVAFVYHGGTMYNNPTSFLQAFVDYLVKNSTITLAQWETVIPSLLPTDKFYVIPAWNNVAVSVGVDIGSPTIKVFDNPGMVIAETYFPELLPADVNGVLDYTTLQFGSYGAYIVPDISNADGRIPFRTKFNDYFLVPVNDVLINRQSVETQNAIVLLTNLVRYASDPAILVTPPSGYELEIKGSKTYLLGTVNRITFAVLINTGV